MRIISERAPLAQLDRATAFEAVGCGFESLRARHFHCVSGKLLFSFFPFARSIYKIEKAIKEIYL